MKSNILFILVLVGALNVFANQPKIESLLYSESEVNRFYRKEHPFKFGYCLGRDTELSNESLKNIISTNLTFGELARLEARGHSSIRDFYFGLLKWKYDIDPDEVLRVRFSQSLVPQQQSSSELLCNSMIERSTVVNNKSKLTGSVVFVVPKNVFVLRIKKLNYKNNESYASSVFAASVLNEGKIVEGKKTDLNLTYVNDDMFYQFVRPGDLVRFDVTYATEALRNVDFSVDFEVGFLGSFRCDKDISSGSITKYQKNLFKIFETPPKTTVELDSLITESSCLQNPLFTRELLLNSQGPTLVNLVKVIQKSRKNFRFSHSSDEIEKFRKIYFSVLSYLSIDLSRNLMQDLSLFCDTERMNSLFKVPLDYEFLTRKYHWTSLSYIQIKYLLAQTTPGAVDASLEIFAKARSEGMSYAQMKDPNIIRLLKPYTDVIMSTRISAYEKVLELINKVPDTKIDRTSRQMFKDNVTTAYKEAIDFHYQLKKQFFAIGSGRVDTVDLFDLPNRWINLKALAVQIRADWDKNLQWFEIVDDDPSSSQFVKDLFEINNVLSDEVAYLTSPQNLRDDFLKRAIMESRDGYDSLINLRLNKELSLKINQCLESAHD